MDFVLAFSLILAFFSIGKSYTEEIEQTSESCHTMCPAGYHKEGDCDDPVAKYRCKKCDVDTFTEIENYIPTCRKCDSCKRNEVVKKPCTSTSDVVCDCKKGFCNKGSTADRLCMPCPRVNGGDEKKRPDRTIQNYETTPTTTTTTSTFMTATASNSTSSDPVVAPLPFNSVTNLILMFLVLVVVTVVGLVWLLFSTIFIRNLFRYSDSCPCWGMNKDLESPAKDPEFNGNLL